MASGDEGRQSCSGFGPAAVPPEIMEEVAATVRAVLSREFDLARPDDVPYLRFQVSNIADRIVRSVLEILQRQRDT
jgi:hypothetical protein